MPSQLTAKDFEYMSERAKEHFDEIIDVLRNMPQAMLLIIRYVQSSELCRSSISMFATISFINLLCLITETAVAFESALDREKRTVIANCRTITIAVLSPTAPPFMCSLCFGYRGYSYIFL